MAKKPVRPIRSERDYRGAKLAVKKLREQAEKESAAERRLQALIRELEKFDGQEPDEDLGEDPQNVYGELPKRRWSDDPCA